MAPSSHFYNTSLVTQSDTQEHNQSFYSNSHGRPLSLSLSLFHLKVVSNVSTHQLFLTIIYSHSRYISPKTPLLQAEIPADVTARALATLVKKQKDNNNKYEYDSDEDVEDGTWEHKQRLAEIKSTDGKVSNICSQYLASTELIWGLDREYLEAWVILHCIVITTLEKGVWGGGAVCVTSPRKDLVR